MSQSLASAVPLVKQYGPPAVAAGATMAFGFGAVAVAGAAVATKYVADAICETTKSNNALREVEIKQGTILQMYEIEKSAELEQSRLEAQGRALKQLMKHDRRTARRSRWNQPLFARRVENPVVVEI